jgi:hypothetical protein
MLEVGRVVENSVTALITCYERRGGGLDTVVKWSSPYLQAHLLKGLLPLFRKPN